MQVGRCPRTEVTRGLGCDTILQHLAEVHEENEEKEKQVVKKEHRYENKKEITEKNLSDDHVQR